MPKAGWDQVHLFGCSIGACFSMMAYREQPIGQTLFLSPVVDMEALIHNMMLWFGISEQQLQRQQTVATPMKPLYWDYYCYVRDHPEVWHKPTKLLYGAKDTLCERAINDNFVQQFQAELTVMEQGEHFFHTSEQLAFYSDWLARSIVQCGHW